MKTKTLAVALCISGALLASSLAGVARADQKATPEQRTSSGTISVADATDRTFTLKQFLRSRRFNLGEDCAVNVRGRQTPGTAADLKPGMEVKVTYQNIDGVLVANRVAQKHYTETGSIKSIDATNKELALDSPGADHTFRVPENCQVIINENPSTLNQLKIGRRVTVRFVKEAGVRIADRIASAQQTAVGDIAAIDTEAKTVKIERLLTTQQYNLADDCKIVVGDNPDARLKELRLGQKVAIDYREANGVRIATRIANAE